MNVVDSSGWLEYFAEGPNAGKFASAIENVSTLIVPVLSIFEVFKRVAVQSGEDNAFQAVALMQQGRVVELDLTGALDAAKLSIDRRLPMADSIILATAIHYEATLWTQDADFKGISGVRYFEKAR